MALPEETPSFVTRSGDDPDAPWVCAPIRETAADELDALYRFAVARLRGQPHLAEDVVQQALLIAMSHASPPAEAPRQRAWLRGIVHNVIRREMRSKRRGRDAVRKVSNEMNPPAESGPGDADRAADARKRAVRALFLALTELGRADQDLFYAFYRAGRSQASIAAELGTTPKGVETRLYRLRSRLRAALDAGKETMS